jgi:hypothetical protein
LELQLAALFIYRQERFNPTATEDNMNRSFQTTRANVVSTLRAAAKQAKLSVDTSHLAVAFSNEAFVANVPIRRKTALTGADLKNGVDLLFIYASLPRGVTEISSKKRIPSGFYTVRFIVKTKSGRGRAILLDHAQRETASLPARKDRSKYGTPRRMSFPVSGHINWCGFGVDVRVVLFGIPVVLAASAQWC